MLYWMTVNVAELPNWMTFNLAELSTWWLLTQLNILLDDLLTLFLKTFNLAKQYTGNVLT